MQENYDSLLIDALYQTSRYGGGLWCGEMVGKNIIKGADILNENAPSQEVPRSFQMIDVDTELWRFFNYVVCVFMDLRFGSNN